MLVREAFRGLPGGVECNDLHTQKAKEAAAIPQLLPCVVLNDMDRFHLAGDVIDRVPELGSRAAYLKQHLRDKRIEHRHYVRKHGDDMPEISGWRWGRSRPADRKASSTEADNV
jgi:xylulose-5-phosphate/fructose-6-phosphate phosphoketolase